MARLHQLAFVASVLALSWYGMMALHELGHVIGALITGGSIERVVLHPLAISRTDVVPNPRPGVVVWLGPLVGCLAPLAAYALVPSHRALPKKTAGFFAGFCLIANGAYIAAGSFGEIGDSGEMLRTGTPQWLTITFGAVTVALGLYLWHRLGSLKRFFNAPSAITPRTAYAALATCLIAILFGLALSPH